MPERLRSTGELQECGIWVCCKALCIGPGQAFMNHPFVDGNKRVALLVTAVFLRMNGFRLRAKSPEFVRFILNEVISKKADVPAIAKWLERWMEQD